MATVEQAKNEITERKPQLTPILSGQRGLELRSIEDMYRFAQYVVKSGFAPKGVDTIESALVAIQMGFEIGLSPLQAIQNIAVINGRPSVWGDAVKGLVLATGACEDFREWFEHEDDLQKCVACCAIKRRGMTEVVRKFSMADAKLAQLQGKSGPWQQYPKRMLQMRARSWACRDAFPDALKGLFVAEEARDMPHETIDVTPARPQREYVSIDPAQITNGEAPAPEDAKATADNSPQPIDPRVDLIARVKALLADLPAQEVRDDMIRVARIETQSSGKDWTKWETSAIEVLESGLTKE